MNDRPPFQLSTFFLLRKLRPELRWHPGTLDPELSGSVRRFVTPVPNRLTFNSLRGMF